MFSVTALFAENDGRNDQYKNDLAFKIVKSVFVFKSSAMCTNQYSLRPGTAWPILYDAKFKKFPEP